ncbi:hypothetical protein EDB92DRAFT_2113439 [Lactarius akahatsu]|uniref:DUF6535 domain-containing protein n=1 Tax=Lactarius akahatsu TaxID=416441 RepID=A0AAD4QEX5_9AGAM|nr:hypothetical protein EDB92DRAFT_2113439 [Lactarius akahatsu]
MTRRESNGRRHSKDFLTLVRILCRWVRGDLTCGPLYILGSGGGVTGNSSSGDSFHAESHEERKDFDDGANALWSLYGKEAKTHDEADFQRLATDMDGVLLFAGLFSAVLTSFLVQSIQTLQVNPAEESVYYQQQSAYYQQQSVVALAQISQQIASIALQVSAPSIASPASTPSTIPQSSVPSSVPVPSTSPQPYPAFKPSFSDIRVNACWLVALVCSLSAALLAILIQQWVRSYMQIFQRYDHPLKRARFRQFFFEGAKGTRTLAEAVPRLIHVSLFLFFLGLGESTLNTNTTVGVTTIVLISTCGLFYLYSVSSHLWDLQSPYKTLISGPIFFLMQKLPRPYFGARFLPKLHTPASIEACQEGLVMEETEERKGRDVRAVRWLVDNSTVNAKMEPLVLAIPGAFNTTWGREVWMAVSSQGRSDPHTLESQTDHSALGGPASLIHHSPRPLEGTAVDTISRSVRYLFETCSNHSYFQNEEARRRRMRACVEAAASLVCGIGFRLEWFGEVGKLVSEIGHIEEINRSPTTTSDPSFIVRWTCLSLVAVQQILCSNRLRVLAGYAVGGLARIQSEYGQPDEAGWRSAQWIEECLKTAWERAEELRRAFEPLSQERTREQVLEILRNHESQISELERIKVEADGMEDVDWRISLYQDAMDDATYRLMRQLPGVSFDELNRSESFLRSDAFNTPNTASAPVTPQLTFPGQRVQALARLGPKLREVLDGQVAEGYEEVLESLKSVNQVPISLRRPNGLMKRQLWRLQDLRDCDGLGFTVELFFLSLRQLLSIPSLHESNSVFYTGTFRIITSHWEKGRKSPGTQHILLNIICDLIIRGRGVFSEFSYPESITAILFDMVGNMLQGYAGPDEHIRDALREIESVDSRYCMDTRLQHRALAAISGDPEHLLVF